MSPVDQRSIPGENEQSTQGGSPGETSAENVEAARAKLALTQQSHRRRTETTLNYAVFIIDANGRIETWTPGAEAVFGWTAEEAIGQPFDMTFSGPDVLAGVPARELATARARGTASDRRWHLRKDRRPVFIEGILHLIPDAGRRERFVKIGQDVSPRQNVEKALNRLNTAMQRREDTHTQALVESRAATDRLRLQLAQVEEVERARLARDLHDEAGQHLAALALGLKALTDVAPPGSEVDQRAQQLIRLADVLGGELHAVAVRLRPRALDDYGLAPALAAYVEAWSQRAQIPVHLHAKSQRLPPLVESAIYRVVQEALTNVSKHASASRASVLVQRHGGTVEAIIEDDGTGFDVAALHGDDAGRLGLRGIQERAQLLGGNALIESTPGRGTSVYVRIPIAADAASDAATTHRGKRP